MKTNNKFKEIQENLIGINENEFLKFINKVFKYKNRITKKRWHKNIPVQLSCKLEEKKIIDYDGKWVIFDRSFLFKFDYQKNKIILDYECFPNMIEEIFKRNEIEGIMNQETNNNE